MSKIGSAPITTQPQIYAIDNGFSLMGNEVIEHQWEYKEGTCCCIAIYHTILTDARLLIRTTAKGCCDQEHTDVSVFLRDISEMRITTENRDCCSVSCGRCCARCCHTPKIIEIRGVFGSQILHIPKADMENMLISIPAAIGNHKLVNHRSFLQ
jgi:hypothetical protein